MFHSLPKPCLSLANRTSERQTQSIINYYPICAQVGPLVILIAKGKRRRPTSGRCQLCMCVLSLFFALFSLSLSVAMKNDDDYISWQEELFLVKNQLK